MSGNNIQQITGYAVPLLGDDIDTDQILPARYMKTVSFSGIGKYLFYDHRFDQDAKEKSHILNEKSFKKASILLVNKNFGCGSSREHAPQALYDYGFRAIIGESFAEIFAGNCLMLGIPTLTLTEEKIRKLQEEVQLNSTLTLSIEINTLTVNIGPSVYNGSMPKTFQESLLSGMWDSIGLLLSAREKIEQTVQSLPYLNNFIKEVDV